jgi:hypothetical protein
MTSTLGALLAAPPPRPVSSIEAFLSALPPLHPAPFDAAVLGGALADRVGYAFVAGIRAAYSVLVPSAPWSALPALCFTEAHGAHPRSIATRLDEAAGTVTGEKKWATLAPCADTLLVLAKAGEAEGRSVLRIARVDARSPGVRVERMPEPPFAPEVPHATVTLEGARVSSVLEGDGFDRYVKPFRTIEDVHVMAAVLAYVVVESRTRAWPHLVVEQALEAIASLRGLADAPALDPATHVALAGALRATRAVFAEADARFADTPDDERSKRWARDRALREVAEGARAKRIEAAWRALAPENP